MHTVVDQKGLTHMLTFSRGCLAITTGLFFSRFSTLLIHSVCASPHECVSAHAQRASRQVHHTRVLNLSPGTEAASADALGASLVGGLWGFVEE